LNELEEIECSNISTNHVSLANANDPDEDAVTNHDDEDLNEIKEDAPFSISIDKDDDNNKNKNSSSTSVDNEPVSSDVYDILLDEDHQCISPPDSNHENHNNDVIVSSSSSHKEVIITQGCHLSSNIIVAPCGTQEFQSEI